MADDKKYYYLKLVDNFFESDELLIMEAMQDGHIYSNILLKLYLRSLKNEGKLMFNDRIPFNSEMLAQMTRHSVGDIERAMKVFQELGLVEILDTGAIYMLDIQNFIGQSSTEADRKREYRARIQDEKNKIKQLDGGQMSDISPDKSPPENRDKRLEIDIDIAANARAEEQVAMPEDSQEVAGAAKDLSELIAVYENEICSISPIVAQDMEEAMNQIGKELLLEIINEAGRNKANTWKYIDKIIQRCLKDKIRTVKEFREKRSYQTKQVNVKTINPGKYEGIYRN